MTIYDLMEKYYGVDNIDTSTDLYTLKKDLKALKRKIDDVDPSCLHIDDIEDTISDIQYYSREIDEAMDALDVMQHNIDVAERWKNLLADKLPAEDLEELEQMLVMRKLKGEY